MLKQGKRLKKVYTKEELEIALQKIKDGMPIRHASRDYKIPRGTLQNRVHNRTKQSVNCSGPPPVLSEKEENDLIAWIKETGRRGFPRRQADVLHVVKTFLDNTPRENPFIDNMPGKTWYQSFLKRHPKVVLRQPEGVTNASSNVSETDIRGWFNQIYDYFKENEFLRVLEDPSRIYNADETSFALCPKTGKVLAIKGTRNVYEIERGNSKENITALMTFSAAGHVVTPLIIYPYSRIPNDIRETIPDGLAIDKSEKGWMNTDVFNDFIKNTFFPELQKQNVEFPVVLFIDGHKSHLSYRASEICEQLNIILVCLYPNATRIQQPADVSVFKPVKFGWSEAVLKWREQNVDKLLTKVRFARIFKIVVDNFIKKTTIKNGFRTTGLYPWNPDAIDYSKCLGKNSKTTGLDSDEKDVGATTHDTSNYENSSLKVIDIKRFGEIVGRETLNVLRQFDGTKPCSSDFALLYNIFAELRDDGIDNIENTDSSVNSQSLVDQVVQTGLSLNDHESEATAELTNFGRLGHSNVNNAEAVSSSLLTNLEDKSNSPTLGLVAVLEVDEFPDLNNVQIFDVANIITESTDVTLNDFLKVPPTPKRKGKKTIEKRKRTFVISSELYKMEEMIKVEARNAEEKAKQSKKDQRVENKMKRLQIQEIKKAEQLETKLKKATEKEENQRKKATEKEENQQKKATEKEEKKRQKESGKMTKEVGQNCKNSNKGTPNPKKSADSICTCSESSNIENLCTKCITNVIGI